MVPSPPSGHADFHYVHSYSVLRNFLGLVLSTKVRRPGLLLNDGVGLLRGDDAI
jgi:hypothetical protein